MNRFLRGSCHALADKSLLLFFKSGERHFAGFNVFETNNMDFESTTRVASKKTTTEFIAGHPNWCHRVMEWQVPVHLQDLAGSGKYIGASAVQGRKVYGLKVSKPKTLYIKRIETAAG